MKSRYIFALVVSVVAFATKSFGQCPGCNINTSYTSPGIYPNPLPDGMQGQPYDQDVTFVMFTDTSGLSVNYFKITSVGGLPFGLSWECNNAANGCQYDPQQSIYGCVKVCGTPLQYGQYTLNVHVDVNLQIVGTQQSTIDIPIYIQPAAGGNSGFTFTPTSGCDSLTVDFNALINGPGMVTYDWNFGDGNLSTETTPQHLYAQPGNYIPTLQTTLSQFALTDVNVATMNENWCGDVEEPSIPFVGCTGDPDPYFVVTDASGNMVYTSGSIADVSSGTWNALNIGLNNPPYSISIWDEDPVSVDDDLGTFSFSPSSTGNINLSGAGGTTINLSIGTQIVATFNDADTIHVFASPQSPAISYLGNDSICPGSETMLSVLYDSTFYYQWFMDSVPLTGETNNTLIVTNPGNYSVVATSASGCSASSNGLTVVQMPPLPNITFLISNNTLTTFLTGFDLQWYQDGAAINGATQSTYNTSSSGYYKLQACDALGCCRFSDSTYIMHVGISESNIASSLSVIYNSSTKAIVLDGSHVNENTAVEICDALGRIVLVENIHQGEIKILSTKDWSSTLYFVTSTSNAMRTTKVVAVR